MTRILARDLYRRSVFRMRLKSYNSIFISIFDCKKQTMRKP